MTDETIALRTRQLENSQIITNLDELIENIRPRFYSENNNYFQVTQWLYLKLNDYGQSVLKLHGLYVWVCKDKDQSCLKEITKTILEDMTVLGEK